MSEDKFDVAVVGLGVMGGNIALNLASRGHRVLGYNRTPEKTHELVANHPDAGLGAAETWEALVAGPSRPRRIILMVPAGQPVDDALDALDPLLEQDDIVVDGGNSLYTDTDRRAERANGRPWRFVGMGVSGGAEGARLGPSIMPGGDVEAWEALKPLLESIAAQSDYGACVTYCGRRSAGHFVKMVHNGIEYGDMQLIAETATLLRRGLGQSADEVGATFERWDEGELDSFLIEITADIFRTPDPKNAGRPLVDAILDQAGQKGTGRWTVKASLDLGVAIPTIAAAVDARVLSAGKALREKAEGAFSRKPIAERAFDLAVSVDELGDALYAAKIASYSQGFTMIEVASAEWDYGIDLSEVARIWTGGCIIRARFLGRVMEAFAGKPDNLAMAPGFVDDLKRRVPALRKVVSQAAREGVAIPGFATSLAWFDTLTTAQGSANVIQAQRDYFGSHTYRRVDDPDTPVHTDWPRF